MVAVAEGDREDLPDAVVDNLCRGDLTGEHCQVRGGGGGGSYQRETHAESQQTTSVGDVRNPGDLLVLQELFN